MNRFDVQPLDLMQFINTKYHDPFIHEMLEFEEKLDTERLVHTIDKLMDLFPLLKCHYDNKANIFVENEHCSGLDFIRTDDDADRAVLLTEALDAGKKLIQLTLSKNILVITISHMICDGSGFKQLIYLLCDIYNGNYNENMDHLMNREFSQLTKEITHKQLITMKMMVSMIGNYKSKQIYNKSNHENIYVMERTLQSDIMSKVHGFAK